MDKRTGNLLKYFHLVDSSLQVSLVNVMGKGGDAILKSSFNKMIDYELPCMVEYLSKTKEILGLEEFTCTRNDGCEVGIKNCPWSSIIQSKFPESVICPLVQILIAIMKRDAKRDITCQMEYKEEGLKAHITEFPVLEYHMEDSVDLLGYLHIIRSSIHSSIRELAGDRSNAIITRFSMDVMAGFDLPSIEEFISYSREAIGLDEFSCRRGNTYQIKISGCPWAKSLHERFEEDVDCPLVFILACIIKKETRVGVNIKTSLREDGVEAEIQLYPESWLEVLILAEKHDNKKGEVIENGRAY